MEEIKSYKTPIYMRKATNSYYHRNNQDPVFMAERNARRRAIYEKHKQDPEFVAKYNAKCRAYYQKKHPKADVAD